MAGRRSLLAVVVVAMSISVGVAVAFGADKGQVDGFGSGGPGPGQFSSNMRGVAVDQDSGRVYVVDASAVGGSTPSRVNVFEADGEFVLRFGAIGVGKGEFGGTGNTWGPQGVAVAPDDGSFYVSDPRWFGGNASTAPIPGARVQKFSAAGGFELMWGWGVMTGVEQFEVCDAAAESCQSGIPGSGAGQLGNSSASARVAVSPVAPHHVFVADPANRRVQEFEPDGDFVRALGWGVDDGGDEFQTCTAASGCQAASEDAGVEAGRFAANQPVHLAVDGDGVLYASDANESDRVQRLDTTAPAEADIPLAPIGGGGAPLLDGETAALAVDRSSGSLLVARVPAAGEALIAELGSPGDAAPDVDFTHGVGEGFEDVDGIDVNGASGDLYVSRSDAREVSILNIGSPPALSIDAPDDVGPTAATFGGTVDPNGSRTFYRFEYRQDGAAAFVPAPAPDGVIPRGIDSAVDVEQQVAGLTPGADYEVRLRADGWGAPVQTALEGFSTPASAPVISPLHATPAVTAALLAARVNPSNEQTFYRFEYVEAAGFDPADPDRWDGATRIPAPDGTLAAGTDDVVVTERIENLQPEIAYRFRIVATNDTDTATGPDQQFVTLAEPGAGPDDQPRAFELVSPADKISGRGIGEWYNGIGSTALAGFPASVGERFAAQSRLGAPLVDGAFAFESDWAFADRIGNQVGWQSHSPFTHAAHEAQTAKGAFVDPKAGVTPDLARLAWTTNNVTLGVFPETAEFERWSEISPAFMSDWGGAKPPAGSTTRWEVFGPTVADAAVQTEDPGSSSANRYMCEIALAADGSAAVCSTDRHSETGASVMFGLAGAGDPTWRRPPDADAPLGRAIYIADTSGPLADSLAGTGKRELVNVCADGTGLPAVDGDGDLGAGPCPAPIGDDDVRLVSDLGATIQRSSASAVGNSAWQNSLTNVVSEDGSRVFFMAPDPLVPGVPDGIGSFCERPGDVCPSQLFVRQRNGDGSVSTRWISKAEDGLFGDQAATLTGPVIFEGATPDGGRVFFRTSQPLTADDPNGQPVGPIDPRPIDTGAPASDSWDLYMYELPEQGDPGEGELTRISAGPDGDGDCNSPLGANDGVGALRFASDDGRRVYFTCQAPLPGVDAPGNGTITVPGGTRTTADRTNLYLYDETRPATQRWRFVARLPRSTGSGHVQEIHSCATTAISPFAVLGSQVGSGSFGVSSGSNCVRGTADGGFITLWTLGRLTADDPDAATADVYGFDADSDELVRITRRQDGVDEVPYPCGDEGESAAIDCHGDGGMVSQHSLGVATEPLVEGDRVAFFQSRSRLVAEDGDDAYDVYMWRNGELSLLTPGDSDTDGAFYKGNDVSGRNVYFVTRDAMSWQDHDDVLDAYTARVDGGIPQPPEPDLCGVLGDGCQPPGPTPAAIAPRTRTAGGANLAPGVRPRLALGRIGAKARRRAARRGVLALRVRTNRPGRIVAVARGRVRARGGRVRVRRVAFSRVRAERAGRVVVRLRLAPVARRQLRRGGRLRLRVRVARPGAHPRSTTVLLRRPRR